MPAGYRGAAYAHENLFGKRCRRTRWGGAGGERRWGSGGPHAPIVVGVFLASHIVGGITRGSRGGGHGRWSKHMEMRIEVHELMSCMQYVRFAHHVVLQSIQGWNDVLSCRKRVVVGGVVAQTNKTTTAIVGNAILRTAPRLSARLFSSPTDGENKSTT